MVNGKLWKSSAGIVKKFENA